jgi:phage-related holin
MKAIQISLISLIAVFAPIKATILVTIFLICADLISGVAAAKKRGEKITSAGIQRSVVKFFVYNMAILTGFLLETYMISSLFPIVKIISSVIGITEGLSVFENLNVVSGNNIFKRVLDLLGSKNAHGVGNEPIITPDSLPKAEVTPPKA